MVSLSVVEALQPVRPSAIDLSEIGGRKTARPDSAPLEAPQASSQRRRALGARAAGGRRLVGRDPAALGVVADHAGGPRPRLRGRDVRARRSPGWERFLDARRRPPAARGLPVADLGHRALGARPARSGRPGRRSPAPGRRLVAARRRGDGAWATGRSAGPISHREVGRSSSTTTSTRMSTTRPSSRWRCVSSISVTRPSGAGSTGRWGCSRAAGLGCVRCRQRGVVALQAPDLRLRQGHGRADRRRDRPRPRGARPRGGLRLRDRVAASTGSSPSRSRTAPGSAAGA